MGSWGIVAAALVVAALLGVGIGWGLFGNSSSPLTFTSGSGASDPGAKPDGVAPVVLTPPKQPQSLGGLTGLLEQARKKFGDTTGFRLVIYPDCAVMDRQDPAEDRRDVGVPPLAGAYTYRGGWGDPTGSAKDSDAVAVDLAKFDAKATVGILRGAPETLGIKQPDVKTTYLIVEPSRDPTTPGAVSLSVYISSDYGSGYIQFAGDGTINRVNYPS